MHVPLIIAILAFLAFALLPLLDPSANAGDIGANDARAYLTRIVRRAKQ